MSSTETKAAFPPSGFQDKPEYAALFSATFRDLPVIQQIEAQWEAKGIEHDDAYQGMLQVFALFDRRMEVIAGAYIYELREQSKKFAELVERHTELEESLQACQQDAAALRTELDKFVSAGSAVVTAQSDLESVLKENSAQAGQNTTKLIEAVRLCRERCSVVVLLQVLTPLLAVSFGAFISLCAVFYVAKRNPAWLLPQPAPAALHSAQGARPPASSSSTAGRHLP